MNCLLPLITHSPSTRSARVFVAPASDPEPGLGEPEPGQGVARRRRSGSQRLLLLVGAEGQDRVDAEPDGGLEGDGHRLVDPADLLDRHAEAGEVAVLARAAVLLRRREPEQPELAHLVHDVDREVVRLVPLRSMRGDLGLGEVAHAVAEVLMLADSSKLIVDPSPLAWSGDRPAPCVVRRFCHLIRLVHSPVRSSVQPRSARCRARCPRGPASTTNPVPFGFRKSALTGGPQSQQAIDLLVACAIHWDEVEMHAVLDGLRPQGTGMKSRFTSPAGEVMQPGGVAGVVRDRRDPRGSRAQPTRTRREAPRRHSRT